MKKLNCWLLVLGLMVGAASVAQAQGPGRGRGGFGGGGFGGPTALLGQASVQEELKLSEDQKKQITDFNEKRRGSFQDSQNLRQDERRAKFTEMAKETEKAVAAILKPEQNKRLKEISLQQRGISAVSDPEVATSLKITDAQKAGITAIQEASAEKGRALFTGGGQGGNREESRAKFAELRKSTEEQIMGLLTAEQQATWLELTGAPFKGEIVRGGPGGRTRRPSGTNN